MADGFVRSSCSPSLEVDRGPDGPLRRAVGRQFKFSSENPSRSSANVSIPRGLVCVGGKRT